MSDDSETAKTAAKDAVQRKIGRNLLLYQQIEGHLKFVLANARASGTLNELAQFREDRSRKITKQMLGLLVEQFLDDILSDEAESSAEPTQLDKPWMSFSFRLQVDQEERELHRKNWELMVEQRNHLVHHFLDRMAPNTLEAFLEADTFLEEQYQKALPTFHVFSGFSRALQETMRDLSAFLSSDEGKEQFRSLLSDHRTIEALLMDVAAQRARSDGWTYLAQLGEELRKNNVDLLLDLKKRHGSLTLKALLAAEGLVDIKDEPLSDGRFRSLYKVRENSGEFLAACKVI